MLLMIASACAGNTSEPGLPFSRGAVRIVQTPSRETSPKRMSTTLSSRCPVSSKSCTNAPKAPATPAAAQTARSSAPVRVRERARACFGTRRIPLVKGGT